MIVDFKKSFGDFLVILSFVTKFTLQHGVLLNVGSISPGVFWIDLLDEFF